MLKVLFDLSTEQDAAPEEEEEEEDESEDQGK